VPIFVLVETIVLYSVWKFRMRPGEELKDGPPIHGNTRLEVIWTAIPAIILVALCSYAYVVLHDIESAEASEMKVRVVGEQFTWTFYYANSGGKEIASPQLYLPEGKQVKFDVQSKDVLHDFWVPAFRQKIDAVPGITTHFRVKPIKTGTFPVVCAELCGLGHSVMRQSAHVVSPGAFDKWLSAQKAKAAGGGGGGAQPAGGGGGAAPDGKTIFTTSASPACGSCHTLSDAGTTATVGPNLDKFLKGKDAKFIQQSIEDPSAFVEKGFQDGIMPPNYKETLQPEEIKALTDYLVQVATK
jgi:cytochrome c oxidase subunit 2